MGTLYIIGNGFDLHFNLKTKTEHFIEHLKKQSVYNEVGNALDVLNCYGVDWCEYEQSLNDIDLDEIELQNEIQPDYMSDRESGRDGGILNMQMYVDSLSRAINLALAQMVNVANNDVRELSLKLPKRHLFENGDAILSFNYTSTIEYLFFIPMDVPVFHIHGFYEYGEPLIFGYRNNKNSFTNAWPSVNEDNWDFYIAQQRETVYKFYDSWKKHLRINELRFFLSQCDCIDRVVVLGHSMSAVDFEYMEEVEHAFRPSFWDISYYNTYDIKRVQSQPYSFHNKMRFIPMNKLLER